MQNQQSYEMRITASSKARSILDKTQEGL